jgi:putative ABC transport system permease protein
VVRTTGEPSAAVPALTTVLAAVDTGLDPARFETLQDAISARLARPRFSLVVVGVFAGVSLLLGMAGIYGLLGYTVSLGRRQLAVRMALGAAPARVRREVIAGGLRLVALGAAGGLAGTLAVRHLLAGLIHGVAPTDPLTLGTTALLLAGSGVLACVGPARHGGRTPPALVVRGE